MSRVTFFSLIAAVVCTVATVHRAQAHCQVPCGIYGDETRFALLYEHITTIEKSMNQINEISAAAKPDQNQLVRWVNNKETHVAEFTEIVTYYFMAQRVKPTDEEGKRAKYLKEVELLHRLVVTAMKCKQGTDTANTKALKDLVEQFETSYLGENKGHSAHGH